MSAIWSRLLSRLRHGREAAAGSLRALWAVAGPYLVRVDSAADGASPQTRLIELPKSAGPLRSVQPADVRGEGVLLVGARLGFLLVRPDAPAQAEIYSDPALDSPLGFNSVAYWPDRDRFVACHGDGGIVQWERGELRRPVDVVRAAELQPPRAGPRHTKC